MKTKNKALYAVIFAILILSITSASIGLFYTTGGEAYEVVNQYGDTVKIYGDGLYAHDSYFRAPLFRGTDFAVLFAAVPLLIIALIADRRKNNLKTRIFLTSVLSVFVYYSFSITFGVTYNFLLLVYIALFSASFFGFVIAIMSMDLKKVENSVKQKLPYKGFNVFLILTGIALIVAWLPDILSALSANRSLAAIEVYTTEITYGLDMGIIAPAALINIYLLKKRAGMGYVLLETMLTLCILIGIIIPMQTVFQVSAGIELPIQAIITKIGIFCLLALFALYFNIRFLKAVDENKEILS